MRRAAGSAQRVGNAGARAAFAAVPPGPPVAAVTGVPVGQQITVAVNTTFNTLFTQLGGVPANPISGLLEGALVLVRRTVFGLVPTGVSATLNGSALEITVDPGSTAYFRQDGASLQVSGDPVFFRVLNEQQFSASSVQTVTATGTGHAGLVFTTGDVNASLDTTGIDSVNFGAGAQFDGSVTATLDSGTLVLYNAVRGMTGVTLDAPQIQLATNVDVAADSLTGTAPDITFTGTVDAKAAGKQSLTVTALGTTTFEGAVGSQAALGSLLTRGIAPLSIPQSSDSQTIPLYYMPQYSASGVGPVKTGIPVAVGNNAPQFYTFDTGGSAWFAGYSPAFWHGVPPVGPRVSASYGNGNYLDGVAVSTPITIGTGANSLTTGPIQVGDMTSGGQTNAENPELDQVWDFSNPNAGPLNTRFFGDFGAGFAQKSVPGQQQDMASALFQLPGSLSSGFLVQLGPIGTQGQLTLGAPQALRDQFPYAVTVATMPDTTPPTPDYPGTTNPALQQFGIKGNYEVTLADGTVYRLNGDKPIDTVFDTGGPSMTISNLSDALPIPNALPPGDTMTATFNNALTRPDGQPGPPLVWTVVAGNQPSVDVINFGTNSRPYANVNTGLDLFNAFDVLFDYQDALVYLRRNGGQSTVILESSVDTTGAQSYQQGRVSLNGTYTTTQGGAVSVAGTTTLSGDTHIDSGSGAVTFSGTIDAPTNNPAAAPALTVNTTGATTFVRAVGWVNPLASLTTTGGGTTSTWSVTTRGSQSYDGDVSLNGPYWVYDTGSSFTVAGAMTLAGPVSVNGCGPDGRAEPSCTDHGVNITLNGTVDSLANKGFTLAVVAGDNGVVEFNGAVGRTNPLGGLKIDSAETVTASGTVSLDGTLGYASGEGLQIGSTPTAEGTDSNGNVGTANFAGGGSIVGFQTNGGTQPNGKCSDKRPGVCGSGVVVNGAPGGSIQGFTIANNASYGIYVTNSPLVLIPKGNRFIGNAGPNIWPLTAQ